jgi:hypothetical protein
MTIEIDHLHAVNRHFDVPPFSPLRLYIAQNAPIPARGGENILSFDFCRIARRTFVG